MLLACYNLLNSQNIVTYQSINNEKWLVAGIPPTQLKKLLKLHRKKSNNWPIVSFIHNGSEITIWMGHSFKTKSPTSRATFLPWHFKDNFFFEFHLISTSTLELYANSLKQLFLQLHLRKKNQQFILPKGIFLSIC